MPELAEVEYARRQWESGAGDAVTEALLHPQARIFRGVDSPALARALTGAKLLGGEGHGKQLFFRFRPEAVLGIHLGMTGRLSVAPADHAPAKHDHLVLRQKKRALVFADPRMFGRVRFAAGKEAPEWASDLPPGILTPGFTAALCQAGLARRKRTPVKAALLDQALFPGIGNWMADEVLWQAGIAPQRLSGTLSDAEHDRLYRRLRAVSKKAMETVGAVKGDHWGDPPADWLFSRRWRRGGRCPRCDAALKHETLRGRTTCWCPVCQPKREKKAQAGT